MGRWCAQYPPLWGSWVWERPWGFASSGKLGLVSITKPPWRSLCFSGTFCIPHCLIIQPQKRMPIFPAPGWMQGLQLLFCEQGVAWKEKSIQNWGVKKAIKCHCIPGYCIRGLKAARTDVWRREGEVKARREKDRQEMWKSEKIKCVIINTNTWSQKQLWMPIKIRLQATCGRSCCCHEDLSSRNGQQSTLSRTVIVWGGCIMLPGKPTPPWSLRRLWISSY